MEKYTWDWYTEDDDSRGRTDQKKRALFWNSGVFEVKTGERLFHGDLDTYRIKRLREDTEGGKEYDPKCILVTHERGEPALVVCNGIAYSVDARRPFITPEEEKDAKVASLERQIRIIRGEEKDDEKGSLGNLFG